MVCCFGQSACPNAAAAHWARQRQAQLVRGKPTSQMAGNRGKPAAKLFQPPRTRQVCVDDFPPVCNRCFGCVGHVWVGNAGAARECKRQLGPNGHTHNVGSNAADRRSLCPSCGRAGIWLSTAHICHMGCHATLHTRCKHSLTAHLLTSTWISGAPKFLLTSRGTKPTCTTTQSLDLCCYVSCSHQQACVGEAGTHSRAADQADRQRSGGCRSCGPHS